MAEDPKPDEFDLIARYFAPLAGAAGLGLSDDAACYTPEDGMDLVISKDLLVAGTHFFPHDCPEDVAFKAISVNVSDLAAKGATPVGYLLGLSLPKHTDTGWFQSFTHGLKAAQEQYGLALIGGDTTSGDGGLVVSVTILGSVPEGTMVRRAGAKQGDDIYVTGCIGDAALGLLAAENKIVQSETFKQRLLHPIARHNFAEVLRDHASASADISDGLLADLAHICDCSKSGAQINQRDIPLSDAARAVLVEGGDLWKTILGGGDDYELIFTAGPGKETMLRAAARHRGVLLTKIGKITGSSTIELVDLDGEIVQVEPVGYKHF